MINKLFKQTKENAPLYAGRFPETVEKPLRGFPTIGLQSAARIICPPKADKFHTCSLRSIFRHVHAAAENNFDFIRACGRELCEAFLTH